MIFLIFYSKIFIIHERLFYYNSIMKINKNKKTVLVSPQLIFFVLLLSMSYSPTNSFTTIQPKNEDSETLAMWSDRWKESRIGWHKNDVNYFLRKYDSLILPAAPQLDIGSNSETQVCNDDQLSFSKPYRILVPLCGKTLDMAFLTDQKGVDEVVGVDGVRKALDEFSAEHERFALKDDGVLGGVERIIGKGISLLRGDFFDLEETMTDGQFDAIYDRASMVAIRPELREKYVDVIRKLIKPGGNILLVTLDRREGTDEAKKAGPPFSIDEMEVNRLYGSQSWVQSIAKVEEVNEFEANPGSPLQNSDLTALYEVCFIIKTKLV